MDRRRSETRREEMRADVRFTEQNRKLHESYISNPKFNPLIWFSLLFAVFALVPTAVLAQQGTEKEQPKTEATQTKTEEAQAQTQTDKDGKLISVPGGKAL